MILDEVDIYLDGHPIAEKVPIDYCMIFVKAIFAEFHLDENLTITIARCKNVQEM